MQRRRIRRSEIAMREARIKILSAMIEQELRSPPFAGFAAAAEIVHHPSEIKCIQVENCRAYSF
jgi:hypothetical protein